MYLNPHGNISYVNKGRMGEKIFYQWCEAHNIYAIPSNEEMDLVEKIDCIVNNKTVAIKHNYNEQYNTVVVEWQQLSDGPAPWIDSIVDLIAFVCNKEVYIIKRTVLKQLCEDNNFTSYIRPQWKGKGRYKILFVPLPFIQQHQYDWSDQICWKQMI